jgi:hypothetical protein
MKEKNKQDENISFTSEYSFFLHRKMIRIVEEISFFFWIRKFSLRKKKVYYRHLSEQIDKLKEMTNVKSRVLRVHSSSSRFY